jgi:hypothetical protein
VLGTSPALADTDGDGFSDLEELARGTSPLRNTEYPLVDRPIDLAMTAHPGSDGKVHVLLVTYSSNMLLSDSGLQVGFQSRRTVGVLSSAWVASHSTSQVIGSASGQGVIQVIDLPIDDTVVQAMGRLSLWARGYMLRGAAETDGASVSLVAIDGGVVLAMPAPRPTSQQPGPQPSNPGTIYVPLPTGGTMPSTWSPGEICFQRSAPVAVQGAMITHEVVNADCLTGWDGFCPPSCIATVGSTYTEVDPIGLIGG